jgi:hypothetical protein
MKQSISSLDGQKTLILKDWLINPLTTADKTALGLTLGTVNKGLQVFDTDLLVTQVWSGTAFVSGVAPLIGAMTYKGSTSSLTTEPASAVIGDTFVYTGTAGDLTWAGITFTPSSTVQSGDIIIKRSASEYDIVQGNAIQATETVQGTAKIATQSITNTGTNDTDVITALKLEQKLVNRTTPKAFLTTGISVTSGVAFTITFPTVSSNKDAFICSVKDSGGNEVICDVDAVSTASYNITSDLTLTGLTVFTTYL